MVFKFQLKPTHLVGAFLGIVLFVADVILFRGNFMFFPFIVIGVLFILVPFWIDYFSYNQKQKEIEERFPDYVRNLVSAVRSGMPVSKAIVYVSKSDYGALNYYVKKMANQIEWNIPVRKVFVNFANEINNSIIKRAITTVLEAEKSGGNIEEVLGSITDSLMTIKKLKEERKATIQAQITQSYVIFFIFLGVLLTIQNVLIPYMAKMEANEGSGFNNSNALSQIQSSFNFDFSSPYAAIISIFRWFSSMAGIFMMLAVFQGFFAGVILGKMSEGDYKSGLRHSIIMMSVAIFILTLANSLLSASFN